MSILVYKAGEHPGGFVGFRVVVVVGGQYRQKYFSTIKATRSDKKLLKKQAQVLDEAWTGEAKEARKTRFIGNHQTTHKARATGYRGLRCVISHEKKCKTDGKGVRRYYSPEFVARGGGTEKPFRIAKHGFEGAWHKAVEYYARTNDLPDGLKEQLIEKLPPKEQFRKIRRMMNRKGHEIPLELLKKVGL